MKHSSKCVFSFLVRVQNPHYVVAMFDSGTAHQNAFIRDLLQGFNNSKNKEQISTCRESNVEWSRNQSLGKKSVVTSGQACSPMKRGLL